MSDITEGLGTAAEGGLLSRAVETKDGEGSDSAPTGGACLNCGNLLTGAHCHACGQRGEVHRSFGAIGHELMHGVLHLDGKIWRTLPLLVRKPGELTRRYIDGERAKFVGPMAMFLFSVFLMFAVFQALGLTSPADDETGSRSVVEEAVRNEVEQVSAQLLKIEAQLEDPTLTEARRAELEGERQTLSDGLQVLEGEISFADWLAEMEENARTEGEGDAEVSSAASAQVEEERVSPAVSATSNIPIISNAVQKWTKNPELMLYKLQANAYKFSWLLIPLSIPFVWLMFAWKRQFNAYDHAIFVTYSIAFMSLLFITLSVLGEIGIANWILTVAALVIPPLHLYKQLRRNYGLSRFSAIWRLAFLMFSILMVLIIFLQVLVLLGAS